MTDRSTIEKLIANILDGTELRLKVDKYTSKEDFETCEVEVRCDIHDEHTGEKQVIEGKGVGLVDAFFNGVVNRYSSEFQSLKSIRFADFSIKADVDSGREVARSDMAATVMLRVANSDGREFVFTNSSPSVTASSIAVVVKAAEFFVNSERAFVAVYRALQHAREEKRSDSVANYTTQMSTLVEATSYSEVIEQIKEKEFSKK